ncbi:MAG: hypothetical protein U0169_04280 [Polyangiaceae bacterium]
MALFAKPSNLLEHALLRFTSFEASLLVGGEAEENLTGAIPSGALGLECGASAGSDERTLVLGSCVDDGSHELVGRGLAVPGTVGGDNLSSLATHCALDGNGHAHISRKAVAARDDKHTCAMFPKVGERGDEAWALIEFTAAADALVGVPGDDGDVLPLGPCLDRGALRFGAEVLFGCGNAKTCHGDIGSTRTGRTHD